MLLSNDIRHNKDLLAFNIQNNQHRNITLRERMKNENRLKEIEKERNIFLEGIKAMNRHNSSNK